MSDPIWHVITGGAGFIGSNLARRLQKMGDKVVVLDDLSLGRRAFLHGLNDVGFHQVDVADETALGEALGHLPESGVEVWHLCANSDIQKGSADPSVDLRSTFLSTFAVLGVMRRRGWTKLRFASTSAVYGDHGRSAIDENATTRPVSNYGAMKLASEAIISAACELFLETANVYRFPNVVGLPSTHGVILDFTRRLLADPSRLVVLGNGTQQKAYLHVSELIDAMLFIRANAGDGFQICNIGPPDDGVTVATIAKLVCSRVAPTAAIDYGEGARGWVGDVPFFNYDVSRLRALGWAPKLTSSEAIMRAVDEIREQELAAPNV